VGDGIEDWGFGALLSADLGACTPFFIPSPRKGMMSRHDILSACSAERTRRPVASPPCVLHARAMCDMCVEPWRRNRHRGVCKACTPRAQRCRSVPRKMIPKASRKNDQHYFNLPAMWPTLQERACQVVDSLQSQFPGDDTCLVQSVVQGRHHSNLLPQSSWLLQPGVQFGSEAHHVLRLPP
jgi:hypothetical protein